jgi:mannose-6-phosphate isomerase-like protein (cupin superfamily)
MLPLEGRSKHFQSFWELELTPGEETAQHQHYDSEEAIYLVTGVGEVQVEAREHRVEPGEVLLVPPRTRHRIANRSDRPLRAITVESRLDLGDASDVADPLPTIEKTIQAQREAQKTARTIDAILRALPAEVDEAVAIRSIVELFDVGGALTERIESEVGLDNVEGLKALTAIEKKIMLAVVQITASYAQGGRGWLLG